VRSSSVWLLPPARCLLREPVGSYNKTWGSLSAVVLLLTWFWLAPSPSCSVRINAEAERSRELHTVNQRSRTAGPTSVIRDEAAEVVQTALTARSAPSPSRVTAVSPRPRRPALTGGRSATATACSSPRTVADKPLRSLLARM
jgi:hypothetical protein